MIRQTMIRSPGIRSPGTVAISADDGLIDLQVPDWVIESVPESVARDHCVLPLTIEADTIVFATPHDTDIMLQDKLRFLLNRDVQFLSRDRHEVAAAIVHYYGNVEGISADSMMAAFAPDGLAVECDDLEMPPSYSRKKWRRSYQGERTLSYQSSESYAESGLMYYTIAEGKRVLAYRRNGKIKVLIGPQRVWIGFTRFEPMKHFVAHPAQYLSIRFLDGRETTQVGPSEVWFDPREHEAIEIHECLDLGTKEAVVVYGTSAQPDDDTPGMSRRVFHGPGLFSPKPGEWLHRFSWHASHGGSRGEEKRPNALQFEKLCLMPDQMYHDVRDVRTADDAVLTIRLMIFFELIDIERMLDTTHDPIGDFINAATSDVVEFTGKRSFDDFKKQTDSLNDIATYGQLLHRAGQCGYKINNVVYRGYGAPDSLQAMHDEAIQSRTRLQLEKATEKQAQEVEDFKLTCQMERAARRRLEQLTEVEHDLETKRQQSEASLKQKERAAAFAREQHLAQRELELSLQQQEDEQKRAHLEALRAMQVDLTEFLTQGRADQVIELRGEGGTVRPDIHLGNGKAKPK